MTATYVYNTQYFSSATTGGLKNNAIKSAPAGGITPIPFQMVVPTTSIDEVNDFVGLCPVKSGLIPFKIILNNTIEMDSHATPTLEADFVLRTTDKNGNHTDTVLLDVSAAVSAVYLGAIAAGFTRVLTTALQVPVIDDADSAGVFGIKIIAAAATAVEGTISGVLECR